MILIYKDWDYYMGMFWFIVLDFLLFEIKEMYSYIIYFEFIIRYCDVLFKNYFIIRFFFWINYLKRKIYIYEVLIVLWN